MRHAAFGWLVDWYALCSDLQLSAQQAFRATPECLLTQASLSCILVHVLVLFRNKLNVIYQGNITQRELNAVFDLHGPNVA